SRVPAPLDRDRGDRRAAGLERRNPPVRVGGKLTVAGASAPTPQARRRREPLRPLRLFWIYFRIGALNELQYRANLAVQVFQSLIALGTGLAVLGLVYSQTTTLGGWTHAELLAVMGVHILMSGPIGVLIQPNMERLMEDIRQGTLDFV